MVTRVIPFSALLLLMLFLLLLASFLGVEVHRKRPVFPPLTARTNKEKRRWGTRKERSINIKKVDRRITTAAEDKGPNENVTLFSLATCFCLSLYRLIIMYRSYGIEAHTLWYCSSFYRFWSFSLFLINFFVQFL